MDNFVAIDFETANNNPSSVCSVGAIVVTDGKIVDKIYRLIRPYPNFYTFWNTKIHGLRYEDTSMAETFPSVWAEIAPYTKSLPIVAHNARFDQKCLKAAFELYNMEYPDYTFFCTLVASRKFFGKDLPNHKLQTVAMCCGYDLTRHHNALADAEACAYIARYVL